MWALEVDVIQDFKYYFTKQNPEGLDVSLKKKEKTARRRKIKGGSMRAIF